MADPLLISLCSVCHIAAPKYKCPRCQTRTCSLSCVKKHKAWSACDGRRDQTAYVPIEKLRTAAGIDHDYNFLSSIERSIERSERTIIDDKKLLDREEIRPDPPIYVPKRVRQQLPNGKVVVRTVQAPLPAKIRRPRDPLAEHQVKRRIQELDINVVRAPRALDRRKENRTRWDYGAKCISWMVEWLLLDGEILPTNEGRKPVARLVHRALESDALTDAFAKTLDWYRKAFMPKTAEADPRWQRGYRGQDMVTLQWGSAPQFLQDTETTAWQIEGPWTDAAESPRAERKVLRFFLAQPNTPANQPKVLVPLNCSDSLSTILVGETILEFPTIYVLSADAELPKAFILRSCADSPSKRRKRATGDIDEMVGKKARLDKQPDSDAEVIERRKAEELEFLEDDETSEDSEIAEDGEVLEDGEMSDEDDVEDSPTSSSGSDSSSSDVESSSNEETGDEADM